MTPRPTTWQAGIGQDRQSDRSKTFKVTTDGDRVDVAQKVVSSGQHRSIVHERERRTGWRRRHPNGRQGDPSVGAAIGQDHRRELARDCNVRRVGVPLVLVEPPYVLPIALCGIAVSKALKDVLARPKFAQAVWIRFELPVDVCQNGA